MSQCSFGSVIMPGNPIVLEKRKEAFSIADKAFLVFDDQFGCVLFSRNCPGVKCIDVLHEFLEVPFFQAIFLYCFHNRDNQVSNFSHKGFIFAIERILPEVVVQITDEMYPTFLLSACYGIIAGAELGDEDTIVVLQKPMGATSSSCFPYLQVS